MKNYNINDMKRGYFVGDFDPTVFHTKNVEISSKTIHKGTLDAGYYRKVDNEIIYIISGAIESNKSVYKSGDILLFEPGEMLSIFAIEDSVILIIKVPGTKGDNYLVEWGDYDIFDEFYTRYYKELTKITGIEDSRMLNLEERKRFDYRDLSVIIQGYVDKTTEFLAKSIRKYLPGSVIILSTWDYCKTHTIDYDKLVISADPGVVPCEIWDNFTRGNNGNRQIKSTQEGLKNVETKYTLKIRSDLVLLGNNFIDYFFNNLRYEEEYKIFNHRIVVSELFSRHEFKYHFNGEEYSVTKPFHPSDWFAFGLTEDIRKMYDKVKLIPDYELQYSNLKHPDFLEKYHYKYSWRYTTEQHIFLPCVREKYPDLLFEDWTDWSQDIINLSDNLMKNNFVFLDIARSGILNTRYITTSFANNNVRQEEKSLYKFNELLEFV